MYLNTYTKQILSYRNPATINSSLQHVFLPNYVAFFFLSQKKKKEKKKKKKEKKKRLPICCGWG